MRAVFIKKRGKVKDENSNRAICNPLKIFPNASYTDWRVIIDNVAIWRLELTITLIKIFINQKEFRFFYFLLKGMQ